MDEDEQEQNTPQPEEETTDSNLEQSQESVEDTTPDQPEYETADLPKDGKEETANDLDEQPLPTEEITAVPPAESSNRIRFLLGITGVLILILIGTIWYFFLRPTREVTPPATPTSTPTPLSIAATSPTPSSKTHLECKFGLCVEVPGAGEDLCSSSFDCEQASIPTSQPSPTPATESPTPSPTTTLGGPETTPEVTTTPTPTVTPTPSPPILTNTPTPSPTPLADQLPESGTTELTFFTTILSSLILGSGWYLLRKEE